MRVGVQQLLLARETAHPLRVGGEIERLVVVGAIGDVKREDGDVAAVEGPLQREQLEEQYPQRPHVAGLAVRLRVDELGREVEGCAAGGHGEVGERRERLGDAEVAQLDRAIGRAVLGEEDVRGLEVWRCR